MSYRSSLSETSQALISDALDFYRFNSDVFNLPTSALNYLQFNRNLFSSSLNTSNSLSELPPSLADNNVMAKNIGVLNRPHTITDSVNFNNPIDWYRFDLSSFSSFNLSLNGLTANVDVELFDSNGVSIGSSRGEGTSPEWLDISLDTGNYYLKITNSSGNSNYRLGLSAAAINVNNNIRTVLGTLDANHFTYQGDFNKTVISGNGNVDFGSGARDILDLSNIVSTTVSINLATNNAGGVAYDSGQGKRIFDAINFSDGKQILFEGIDKIRFSDRTIDLSVVPNDPLFTQQWNLHMMGVQNAWRFTEGSSSVLIGVEDSGLAVGRNGSTHNDLRTEDTLAYLGNVGDDFSDGWVSHGTAVQGIIAARSNNGAGMSGINSLSQVVHIDVLGSDRTDQSLATATQNIINQAQQQGKRLVINFSLGVPESFGLTDLDPNFEKVVADNPNVLFVIAAGNSGGLGQSGLDYPAALAKLYTNVIAVGAVYGAVDVNGNATTPGSRIPYSNYGQGLTLVAPSEVIAPYADVMGRFGFWRAFNGTSAAAPNVTGVASLIWSANPNLNATQVSQILTQTAYDVGNGGYDEETGSGFVNADAAVRRALALARG